MNLEVYKKLDRAFKTACPIVSLTTSDPAAATRQIIKTVITDAKSDKDRSKPVLITWDVASGVQVPPQERFADANKIKGAIGEAWDITELLGKASDVKLVPADTIIVVYNAHKQMESLREIQAIWNVRDVFKNPKRMLVLMGTSIRVPVELQNDVVELDEPLPTEDDLKEIVRSVAAAADVKMSEKHIKDAAVASSGLSAFAAEQFAALNLSKKGVSSVGVWADKCRKIDETPGLKVVSGGSFDDVAGVEAAKDFLSKILTGDKAPAAIVFLDEIEKAIGGAMGDSSGVSQDQLGVLLQWMQDKRATGCVFVGPAGAAKSALAKTAGGEAGIPTIQLDLGGMKGSLVGESESRIREALKVVDAVSGGNTLWLATSNNVSVLPPELRRRFKYGTWFFDLPTRSEREQIWNLYTTKFGLAMPSEDILERAWTGAEIESCCEIADRTGLTVDDSADYIVPVSVAGAEQLARLRAAADGKFLSASTKGVYRTPTSQETQAAGVRQFADLGDE